MLGRVCSTLLCMAALTKPAWGRWCHNDDNDEDDDGDRTGDGAAVEEAWSIQLGMRWQQTCLEQVGDGDDDHLAEEDKRC